MVLLKALTFRKLLMIDKAPFCRTHNDPCESHPNQPVVGVYGGLNHLKLSASIARM
jgi:hypothetical protein